MDERFTITTIGNPNTGKTTLFNALTGSKQHVGNWPGVTVEQKIGQYSYQEQDYELVDLPGVYSLESTPGHAGLDEEIAQNYILSKKADLIVNIVDASNLERNLYLTTQLLDMGVPIIIALNMMDIAQKNNIKIDVKSLSNQLNVPIILISAAQNQGIDTLKENIAQLVKNPPTIKTTLHYPDKIESNLKQLQEITDEPYSRWTLLRALEGDYQKINTTVKEKAQKYQEVLEEEFEEDVDIIIADSRYSFINSILEQSVKKNKINKSFSDKVDRIVLNRFLGIPLFLLVMYLMFMFTINIAGAFIDFFDILFGTVFVDGLSIFLDYLSFPNWLNTLIANGIGGGIQVVATFIPIIGFLYLFLSFLEDSGYMARAAFVMDRFMRFMGLPGKSFVPMIVGFGCNVPAIMATRTLENPRDRILTILMNPFMSCGARLPVYALFAAAFFPQNGQNLVFLLYIIGILMAVLTGLIMKHTLFKGEIAPFIMELPNYHMPTLKGIVFRTWDRLKGFIVRAGVVIVPMVVIITFFNSLGIDGSYGNDNTDKSVLSVVGKTITPVFTPMGLDEENWPATVGIFTGILAKEVVVGTLDAAYTQLAAAETGIEEESMTFMQGIQAAFASIPENLSGVVTMLTDPLGLNIGNTSNTETAAQEQAVSSATFGAMVARFDGQIGAFAYLLFILMYFPCVAATAAIKQETNHGWAIFVAFWTTFLAYTAAVSVYQLGTFAQHPLTSIAWIVGLLTIFVLVILGLYRYGKNNKKTNV